MQYKADSQASLTKQRPFDIGGAYNLMMTVQQKHPDSFHLALAAWIRRGGDMCLMVAGLRRAANDQAFVHVLLPNDDELVVRRLVSERITDPRQRSAFQNLK